MARLMPVLPEVGSRMTEPGCSSPSFSAAATMYVAARSFTDPVGFRSSSLAHSRTFGLGDSRGSPTRGVPPVASSRESYRIRLPASRSPASARAAGYRRQHRDRIAVAHRGGQTAQEAHVFVVQIHVDEAAQAGVVHQPFAQPVVTAVEIGE